MSDKTNLTDNHALLGIAFADQTLIATQLAMFAAKTASAQETIELLRDISEEIAERYKLSDTAKQTMQNRISETVNLALAIVGNKSKSAPSSAGTH